MLRVLVLCFHYFTDNSNDYHLMFKIYFRTVVICIKEPIFLFLRATDMDPRTGGFYVI